ncbi:MAG TPA: nucleotidyltransferase family protein [Oscillospiraceae bacterium]|nr:nucleotidyltransferase family protein [Oscillospiraceae bacterium]HPF55458.1 nucleotidyltransferase family protein [Clostridiales bacterium]HPK34292.1 nucleotidyltransferase family protein [Oscillospiraceae bacterium]HPR74805.1 nucleotidyltransferase family protein [Oscillospiraceae bacterium]
MICGVTTEYNPLHNGHIHQLNELRRNGAETIVAVMSGNFVQRGEPAICDKWTRARAAVECGVDLVVELPSAWVVASAQRFAEAAVGMMAKLGVDTIGFGCECGDGKLLKSAAEYLSKEEFHFKIKKYIAKGMNYPSAVSKAAELYSDILSGANNALAIEYIRAAEKRIENCNFIAVKRIGTGHDEHETEDKFASASKIRKMIVSGENYSHFIPETMASSLEKALSEGLAPASLVRIERGIIAKLRTMSPEELRAVPDVSEGLENRILSAAKSVSDLESLYGAVKSKRFTHARIRRIILNAYLDTTASLQNAPVPYIRPLAFNKRGSELIKAAADQGLPIYTKSSKFAADPRCSAAFEHEAKTGSVYALCLPDPLKIVDEYRATPAAVL